MYILWKMCYEKKTCLKYIIYPIFGLENITWKNFGSQKSRKKSWGRSEEGLEWWMAGHAWYGEKVKKKSDII